MKPDDYVLKIISQTINHGYTYNQGLAIFKTTVYLMEEINKNPSIDTDYLANIAEKKLMEVGYNG